MAPTDQHPPNTPPVEDELTSNPDRDRITSQEYKTIVAKIGDHRKRFLRDIDDHQRDLEETGVLDDEKLPEGTNLGLSKSFLCSVDGTAVPSGSFEYHVEWLRGSPDFWPPGVGPFIEVVDYDETGRGEPARCFGLTEDGQAFVDMMRSRIVIEPGAGIEDLRVAVRARGDQVNALSDSVSDLDGRTGSIETRIDDIETHVEEIENRIKKDHEQEIHRLNKILDILEANDLV